MMIVHKGIRVDRHNIKYKLLDELELFEPLNELDWRRNTVGWKVGLNIRDFEVGFDVGINRIVGIVVGEMAIKAGDSVGIKEGGIDGGDDWHSLESEGVL